MSQSIADFNKQKDTLQIPDSITSKFSAGSSKETLSDKHEEELFYFQLNQNKRVYAWQNTSSIIIFFVVILIVLTGLYMSYMQFKLASGLLTKKDVQQVSDAAHSTDLMNASLEFSKEGVKINTAVIGLVILLISLSFLFLYLKYVYPITIVQNTTSM